MADRDQSLRRIPGSITEQVTADISATLLSFNEMVRPFHEWIAGQRAYFNQQGYTDDEARAMSAALFVQVFGGNISRTIADQNPEDGGQ